MLPFCVYSEEVKYMSMEELKEASQQGNNEAKMHLADNFFGYRNQFPIEDYQDYNFRKGENLIEGARLYEELAAKGHFEAIHKLGKHLTEEGREHRDIPRAVKWYEHAVRIALKSKFNNTTAVWMDAILGRLFLLHETGVHSSQLFLENGLFLYHKTKSAYYFNNFETLNDGDLERQLYKQSKEETAPLVKLAELYVSESLSPMDHFDTDRQRNTRFLLMEAAKRGSIQAMFKLADAYMNSLPSLDFSHLSSEEKKKAEIRSLGAPHTGHTMKQAVDLYTQAFRKGSLKATERLAHIYQHGVYIDGKIVVDKNYLLSRNFHQAAIKRGSPISMDALATIYEDGHGLGINKQDFEKAIQYRVMILENIDSHSLLHVPYKVYERSAAALRRMAEDGEVEAIYHLGRFYEQGLESRKSMIPKNETMAALLYEKAAEKGHEEARTALRNKLPEDFYSTGLAPFACASAFSL